MGFRKKIFIMIYHEIGENSIMISNDFDWWVENLLRYR